MKRQLFFLTLFCFALAGALQAQSLQFNEVVYDFGTLKEEVGSASYTFVFTNGGTKPISLSDVKPSCGCTTPEYSKEPVAAGAKGTIKAVYSTTSRPGKFEKFITVRAREEGAAEDQVVVLTIRGDVTPRQKTIADYFPQQDGGLRLTTNHVAFGRLANGTQSERSLGLYNETDAPITLTKVVGPSHVSFMFQPGLVIQPKDSVKIPVIYDGTKVTDWGFVHHSVVLETNDPIEDGKKREKRLYVSADINEDFSKLTPEELASAPKASFDKKEHDFGEVAQNSRSTTQFSLTNSGQRPLIIRKTKASCGCTATEPAKTVLQPGETTTISVTFDATGKNGKQQKSVMVITNDPKESMINLLIKADIHITGNSDGSSGK